KRGGFLAPTLRPAGPTQPQETGTTTEPQQPSPGKAHARFAYGLPSVPSGLGDSRSCTRGLRLKIQPLIVNAEDLWKSLSQQQISPKLSAYSSGNSAQSFVAPTISLPA